MRRRVVVGKTFDLKASVPRKGRGGKQPKGEKKRSVVVGRPWDFDAKLARSRVEIIDAWCRSGLAAGVFIVGTVFLAGSAILGIMTHSFLAIGAVWAVVGPVWAALAMYYFGPRKDK